MDPLQCHLRSPIPMRSREDSWTATSCHQPIFLQIFSVLTISFLKNEIMKYFLMKKWNRKPVVSTQNDCFTSFDSNGKSASFLNFQTSYTHTTHVWTRITWRFDAELESNLQYYPVEHQALLFSEVFFRYPTTTDSSTCPIFSLIPSLHYLFSPALAHNNSLITSSFSWKWWGQHEPEYD